MAQGCALLLNKEEITMTWGTKMSDPMLDKPMLDKIYVNILEGMEKIGISEPELINAANLQSNALELLRNGFWVPNAFELHALSAVLGQRIDWLVGDEKYYDPDNDPLVDEMEKLTNEFSSFLTRIANALEKIADKTEQETK